MLRSMRLVLCTFLFLGLVTFLEEQTASKAAWLANGRATFAESLGQTRARLVNGAWQAVNDQAIQQNIELKNFNTVGQTLQNYLRAGEVSQIELVDDDCNLLARVPMAEKPLPAGCRPGAEQDVQPTLFWHRDSDAGPTLSVRIPKVIGGQRYLLVSHVVLDQAWLSAYPSLAWLVSNKHDFNLFEDSSRGLVWIDGFDDNHEPLATIRMAGWLSRIMPNFMHYSLEPRTVNSFWWLYLLTVISLAVVMGRESVYQKQDHEKRVKIRDWIRERCATNTFRNLKIADRGDDWFGVATQMQSMIDRVSEQKQTQVRLLKERQEQLSLGAVQRDREISDLQERLAGMSDLSSLKEQLQHSTESFLGKMEDVRDLCETMFDIASSGLAKRTKELNDFCGRWKAGVADESHRERGARKFFRSLSESAGSKPGRTKLDDELDTLSDLASTTLDQSLNLAMLTRQTLAELESGVQVAALWHGLAMRDSQRERTADWVACLTAAQRLVAADTRYATLTFERLPATNSPEETYPPVAKVAMISGMFHLYMALLSDVKVNAITLPIVLRQKRFHDHGTIILSLPQPAADVADAAPGRSQSYHLELAKAIFAPLRIRVAFLPPTVAGVPVALTWTLPGKEVDVTAKETTQPSKPASESRVNL